MNEEKTKLSGPDFTQGTELGESSDHVPFFWTEQYAFGLGYVRHAEHWDKAEIVGSLGCRDCTVTYWAGGKKVTVAVVHRDLEGLRADVEFERTMLGNCACDRSVKSPASPA